MQLMVIAQNTVSNVLKSATSTVATLTVSADTIPPVVVNAFAAGLNQVIVVFSERVSAATATSLANYSITGLAGTLTLSNAALNASQTNVTLTVSTMTAGSNYTVTINGVRDRSAAANSVAANSQVQFTASATASIDIGEPGTPSFITSGGNGFNVSAVGTNIGGIGDQFTLAYQQVSGNFDVKVRIPAFSSSDPFARAGLMARETLTPDSRFAASLSSPNVGGSSFFSRNATAAAAVVTGAFPGNYPYNWLRLARSGDVFTGYASFDGQNWVQLGTVTMALGSSVYFGMAASSGSASQTASVEFRDQQSAAGGVVMPSPQFAREPLSASSRRTGLVISEIMYHPKSRTDGKELEFIELYNSMSIFEDLSGYRLSGDVGFTFPPGTIMQAGQFIVVAKAAADVSSTYGISGVFQYGVTNYSTNIVGNVTNLTVILETNVVDGVTNVRPSIANSLNNSGGTVRLRGRSGQVLLEVNYDTDSPWPAEADGSGHSLVLARASYGEDHPEAWGASDLIGGSPGTYDSLGSEPARNIVINEFLAHTDPPFEDMIELYNHGTTPINISGFWLSDDLGTNKYRIADGTVLQGRAFIAFTQTQLGFALTGSGEEIVLVNSNRNRVIDALKFDGQENGVSMGRYPDGAPTFRRLAAITAGTTNAAPSNSPIVINEIMYSPISGNGDDEFIELYNRSASAVNIGEWRFENGIDYTFPKNTIIGPGSYLVVAKNATRLRANYPNLNTVNCLGNFNGNLANSGERVSLAAPDYEFNTNNTVVTTNVSFRFIVNEVPYKKAGKWGYWADGGGSSLELIDSRADNSQPANWADSDESMKSTWTSFEATGIIDWPLAPPSGVSGDQLQVMLLGVGEAILDDLEVRTNANGPSVNVLANGNFENSLVNWTLQGSHDQSFIENTGGFTGRGLHVMAASRGDNGVNRIRSASFLPPAANSVATIRGKARWVRGFPEVLLRLRGGVLEAFGRLPVPANLGSPGAPNSRAITNAGPAIYDVVHTPALPQANESVRITARATDPNGVSQLMVRYRSSAAPTTFSSATMLDNGTGGDAVAGDGLFTATLTGQATGNQIGFHVVGVDGANVTNLFPAAALSRSFPNDAPTHECIVRWGDP
ncbi:MAG TPA: lamin tail domain-containing protein, partial [Candidatus Acidoferrum sp.]|nr:lamin tail domain-containing protein [Candidatus Acidoferrum sp.]